MGVLIGPRKVLSHHDVGGTQNVNSVSVSSANLVHQIQAEPQTARALRFVWSNDFRRGLRRIFGRQNIRLQANWLGRYCGIITPSTLEASQC